MPIDIETRRFPMKFRGFHPEEVASFLEQIREELEDLLRENAALKEQIHKSDVEIQRFWEMQELLRKTLQDAHQMSEEFKVRARIEADSLLEQAEERARDMVGEAREEALQLSEQIVELKMIKKQFDCGMRNLISSFEAVIADATVFQGMLSSDTAAPVQESDQEVLLRTADDDTSGPEVQIGVVEGHGGEEGSSDSEQY